jgi:acetate kinase
MKEKNVDINNIMTDLNKKSGLIGISGISNDARDIEDAILRGEQRAILAYKIFERKIASYIASYNCLLDGTDAIVFTGGLGANSQMIRANVIQMISALGVKIDESKNNVRGIEQKISDSTSTIDCYVIPTNEELLIVRETYDLIK